VVVAPIVVVGRAVVSTVVVATALVVSSVVVVMTASAVYILVKLECVTQSAQLRCLKCDCGILFCFFVIVSLFSYRPSRVVPLRLCYIICTFVFLQYG